MTTITIDLPDDVAAALDVKATAWKTSVSALLEGAAINLVDEEPEAGWDSSLSPEDIEAIEAGLADAAAGRVRPWEQVRLEMRQLVSK
jgi:predicted transcriptional regulator